MSPFNIPRPDGRVVARIKAIWNWLFGSRCCRCNCRGAYRQRMNTQYIDEESNWTIQCDRCMDITEEEWASMWADYYRGLL